MNRTIQVAICLTLFTLSTVAQADKPPPQNNGHPADAQYTAWLPMTGHDDRKEQRWADLFGNYYAPTFINTFSYAKDSASRTAVFIRHRKRATFFEIEINATGLKPNFVYQVKLVGDAANDEMGFGLIGRNGRWLFDPKTPNVSDEEFRRNPNKENAQSYILFDYFVTDAHGDATHTSRLNKTYHVIWKVTDRLVEYRENVRTVKRQAHEKDVYSIPKEEELEMTLWAEPEDSRAQINRLGVRLPPRAYAAQIMLTEESFHSTELDGGWWATAFTVPVNFVIIE